MSVSFDPLKSLIRRIVHRKKPLLMFHHLAKNAGSSLRQILQSNYTPEELLEFYSEPDTLEPIAWYRDFYLSLSAEHRRALKCLSGHSIHYLLPTLAKFEERPCRVFCILRHPVDRMVSLYHFVQGFVPEDGQGGIIAKIIRENGWRLEDIYLKLGGGDETTSDTHFLFREFFNGQARTILLPHISTVGLGFSDGLSSIPRAYKKKLKKITDAYYVMGTQENYNLSVDYFGKQFGWQNLVYEKTNITESRPALDTVSPELVQLVERYNALDVELYRAAVADLQKFAPRTDADKR